MELKVGKQFEVVEVLTDGGYFGAFKVGGWVIAHNTVYENLLKVLPNKYDPVTCQDILTMIVGTEVKPVGRLTVKEVKS